jgi:hypothetical protein
MVQDLKLILFAAAIASASFSQTDGFGYGAAVQMTAAALRAMARLIAQWRHRSMRSGDRLDLRCLRQHPMQHV